MEKKKKEENTSTNHSRRSFLKKSAIASLGALSAGVGISKVSAETEGKSISKSFSLFRKEHESIDVLHPVAKSYQRFDEKNITLFRNIWDPEMDVIGKSLGSKLAEFVPNPQDTEPGYGQLSHALMGAAAAGLHVGTAMGMRGQGPLANWENHSDKQVSKHKHEFSSGEEAAKYIKRAAQFLGASDVGIAPFDERWLYSKWYGVSPFDMDKVPTHEVAKLPFEPKSVIVTIHEMDYDLLQCPGIMGDTGPMKGYSEMTETAHKIAVFLNRLGYKSLPVGNDTSLSIPTAIQAGLGEYSRMGTMIHEKLGSRVRIGKVYTDLDLAKDKPITFGVKEFCKKCKKCAELCPSNAITLDEEQTQVPKTDSISSNPGVKKWYQNNEKCISQWERIGGGCNICVAVCPYNKLDTWVHDLSKLAVSVPVGRDIARQLDDAFGYGSLDPKNVDKFWNK